MARAFQVHSSGQHCAIRKIATRKTRTILNNHSETKSQHQLPHQSHSAFIMSSCSISFYYIRSNVHSEHVGQLPPCLGLAIDFLGDNPGEAKQCFLDTPAPPTKLPQKLLYNLMHFNEVTLTIYTGLHKKPGLKPSLILLQMLTRT